MTLFMLVAVFMLLAALMFVMPVLLRSSVRPSPGEANNEVNLTVLRDQLRELDVDLGNGLIDQAGYAAARAELEKRVASDVQNEAVPDSTGPNRRWSAALIGLTIPVVAIALYYLLGTPNSIDPAPAPAAAQAQQADPTPQQIDSMVAGLEQKLKNNPDDVQGLDMLARSYHTQRRYREAAETYAHLVKLVPANADILADYADSLGMAQNKSLQGEPEKIIYQALQADPRNIKALALSGSAAFDRKDFAKAIEQWKKVLTLVDAQSETAKAITGVINEAQGLASGQSVQSVNAQPPVSAESSPPAGSAISGKALEGQVRLDAAVVKNIDPDATVFIFARAEQGRRFPLAVLKKQVKDLPVTFKLDDSMGMMPNVKLSDFPKVVVGARISASGSATPAPGDWEGLSAPVAPGATGLSIVINSRHN